ncbi:hypothetical protein J7I93_04530 [Bacillus sp. ISL-47]|uniref:DUF3006 domain-containing protein n=1 Tax=Bacillus sp. ISL-47 TaxID=2819130 RepID=UPI001BE88DFA|nr:DUF3006 domain-containing protein [Bacillus sp. ISL-47]MBT2687445.1 hypothetical protein [Bacillus sp. ISL-47]MBT2707093.1 hypothetical protein [Pseudomonas sp. ISL-84]
MERYTVDAIEGEKVVLLPSKNECDRIVVSMKQFSSNLSDGDIIEATISSEGKVMEYKLLSDETQNAFKKNQALLQKILNKNKK